MKIIDGPQFWLRPRLALHHGPRQSWEQFDEAKPTVEAVGCLGQIAPRVLGLPRGVVTAADGTFDVAEHHVHPTRPFDLGRSASAFGFQHGMCMIQLDDAPETAQAIAEDFRIGRKASPAPVGERSIVEAAHRFDDGKGRVFQRLGRGHGHHERLFVFRPTPGLAAVAFTAEVASSICTKPMS